MIYMQSKNITISPRDAAQIQLDRAIVLFIDQGDFVSAVTLACAAESIFGEHIRDNKLYSPADLLKSTLKRKYSPDLKLKEINDQYVNRARNFFKHKAANLDEGVPFEMETEAISAIVRSISNSAVVTGSVSDAGVRFLTWLKSNRPDLFDDTVLEDEPPS